MSNATLETIKILATVIISLVAGASTVISALLQHRPPIRWSKLLRKLVELLRRLEGTTFILTFVGLGVLAWLLYEDRFNWLFVQMEIILIIVVTISAAGALVFAKLYKKSAVQNKKAWAIWHSRIDIIFLIFFILSFGRLGSELVAWQRLSESAKFTSIAWDAERKDQWDRAIAVTDKCIARLQSKADADQAALQKAGRPLPGTGHVSDEEKARIFEYGQLNDVATCFFIKALSAEASGKTDLALEAYRKACGYTYARAWDTRGWFWSPSEESCHH